MSWPRALKVPSVGPRMPSRVSAASTCRLPLAPSSATCSPRRIVEVDPVERHPTAVVDVADAAQARKHMSSTSQRPATVHPTDRPTTTAAAATGEGAEPAPASRTAACGSGVRADLAREAARQHRRVDVVAHFERAAHQRTHRPGDPASVFAAAQARHDAALARLEHAVERCAGTGRCSGRSSTAPGRTPAAPAARAGS